MSSRKHYIDVAAALKAARELPTVPRALDHAIDEIAVQFKRDNGRFDRTKFLAAAAHREPQRTQDEITTLTTAPGGRASIELVLDDDDAGELHIVRVEVDRDADGGFYVNLGGLNCNLEGEMPGMYYPSPITTTNEGATPA